MTFITVDILGGSVGIILSLVTGVIVTYVSILKASSNKHRQLMIKTIILIWVGVILLLVIPLIFSSMMILPEWGYWLGVITFLVGFIPFISNYYKKRAFHLSSVKK